MARRSGLVNDPLEDEFNEDEQKAVVKAAVASGSREQDLDVDKVAPDPENPKGRLTPKRNVVDGIASSGQKSAGMVQPLDRWIAQGGNPESLPPGTEYVIVFGHGRWAACKELGRTFRAVVNTTIEDLTEHIVDQLQENLNRENLSPIEEAQGFQRLVKRKLSQRQIAAKLGIPQPHINKRLKLLNLPEEAQAAIDSGSLPIEAALKLAEIAKAGGNLNIQRVAAVLRGITTAADNAETNGLDEEQRTINQQNAAKRAVTTAYAEFEAEKALNDKRTELTKAGATLIDNPRTHFADRPRHYGVYLLTDEDTITAARADGTAVAHVVSGDRVDWYTTQDPTPETTDIPAPRTASADQKEAPAPPTNISTGKVTTNAPDVIAHAQKAAAESGEQAARAADAAPQARAEADREQHERQKAAESRAAACLRIAAKAPARDALTDRLARRMLSEDPYGYADEARELVLAWLLAAHVIDGETAATLFTDKAPRLDTKTAARVAYIYDLALSEARARDDDRWDSTDAEYIQRLKDEAAYQTSEWEDNHFYPNHAPSAL